MGHGWTTGRRHLYLIVTLVGTALVLASCGASGASQPTKGPSHFTLGIVSISTSDFGNHETILGATAAAKARGWSVDVINANGSADLANSAIEDLVQKKVGAIFDLVFPTDALLAGLTAAKNAHIPVATWGGGLGPDVVATDGGGGVFAVPVVKYMLTKMGRRGSVLALTYHAGLVCRQRETVFRQLVGAVPAISVTYDEIQIPGYTTEAPQYATAWLASHPKGSEPLAIWGCWEDPTIAAISALQAQGRTDVMTFGENGGPTAITDIEKGILTATEWENSYLEGEDLVRETADAIKAGSKWKPVTINVPGILVTAQNVKAFIAAHPGSTS